MLPLVSLQTGRVFVGIAVACQACVPVLSRAASSAWQLIFCAELCQRITTVAPWADSSYSQEDAIGGGDERWTTHLPHPAIATVRAAAPKIVFMFIVFRLHSGGLPGCEPCGIHREQITTGKDPDLILPKEFAPLITSEGIAVLSYRLALSTRSTLSSSWDALLLRLAPSVRSPSLEGAKRLRVVRSDLAD